MKFIKAAFLASSMCVVTSAYAGDRTDLTVSDLTNDTQPTKLVQNAAFLPPEDAQEAHESFEGTITLSETEMSTEPAKFKSDSILGKNPRIFPAAVLSFVTHEGDLVPTTQDVQRYGSTADGKSYWDIIVQAGKVWSEPGDNGWSRASFPFALMHSIEGETHSGVATFLYKNGEVSGVQFQVLTETAPFYVEDYFTAVGKADAVLSSEMIANADEVKVTYAESVADAVKLASWADLEAEFGKTNVEKFDSDINPDEIVVDGISVDGTFYLKSCPTVVGELPYCDRQRFGVWSMTKAASNAAAILRLAEKFGPEVFDAKITDYISEAKGKPGWDKVTFGDMLNMASGLGNGSDVRAPNNISDGYIDGTYGEWYEARSEEEKIEALLKNSKVYPWGPGQVARYRDVDMFLLGVAMTRYIKEKGESYQTVWDLLSEEVYKPIGIHYAPINRTIEADQKNDQPLMAYGYYPTVSDLVKITTLFQNGGKFEGKQILNAELVADIMPSDKPVGLFTGDQQRPYYRKAFWRGHMDSGNGCSIHYPMMDGWGANYAPIFSKDVFAIRIAKDWDNDAGATSMDSMETVADHVSNLCN
jgi:CubicO group peptidase (beta-lactamase class C family)